MKKGHGGNALVGFYDNVTPLATVPTIRPTERHKLLPPEGDRTVSPISRFYHYFYFIQHVIKP
jgi:hypothetical protein